MLINYTHKTIMFKIMLLSFSWFYHILIMERINKIFSPFNKNYVYLVKFFFENNQTILLDDLILFCEH